MKAGKIHTAWNFLDGGRNAQVSFYYRDILQDNTVYPKHRASLPIHIHRFSYFIFFVDKFLKAAV